MRNEPEQDSRRRGPDPGARRPFLSPSRIVLLILVAAAAVVIVQEMRALSACDSSYIAVDEAMTEATSKGESLFRKDLDGLLQGSPAREYDEEANVEVFTWHGLLKPLKTYRVRVEYGEDDYVKGISPE
jgi:hypothetical protein